MSTGKRIRGKRAELGIKRKEFAKLAGVNENTIYYWEHDASEPTVFNLIVVADILGVSLDWLAERTDKQEVNR